MSDPHPRQAILLGTRVIVVEGDNARRGSLVGKS